MIATGLALIALFLARVVFASMDWYLGPPSNADIVIALGGAAGALLTVGGLVRLAWAYLP